MAGEDPIQAARVGLCYQCAWMRRVESQRGSVFYLCGRHRLDRTFRKYPPLPVLRCHGFDPNPEEPVVKPRVSAESGQDEPE